MAFSDQASDECRELSDSSDDDGFVDPEFVSVTKRKSRSKRLEKIIYYDESITIAHELLQVKLCFADVHQYRRALTNYHVVNQRDFEYLRNDHNRITIGCNSGGTCPFAIILSTITRETSHVIRWLALHHQLHRRLAKHWLQHRLQRRPAKHQLQRRLAKHRVQRRLGTLKVHQDRS
jgi:hypothetical protein